MREKLNENPMMQVALIGVLVVVVGFLLLTSMGGGGESSSSSAAEPEGSVETAEAVSSTTGISAPIGKGMPRKVESAFAHGETIALLVYSKGGIDDKAVRKASSTIAGMPHVALFTTPTTKVADYAAITGPIGVSQVPALIVVPHGDHDAAAPATVTYGFHSPEQLRQAVIDAHYTGESTYAPR